ncbi:hypothetical protein [Thermococcus sp.]|uniref:hypothetical protein n=1 Tax=Thermococcus sp. TaxID=35749 RepID=UPI002636A6B1|nr:hypothetical protein [Thermococcus sp.]
MRRIWALLLAGLVLFASGCIGDSVGLNEEKVMKAIESIHTGTYQENVSITMNLTDPSSNKTVDVLMKFKTSGAFNLSSGIEAGNFSLLMEYFGMNITANWPYFLNGTQAFFRIKGKWYNVTNADIANESRGSLNIEAIKRLLNVKNVTIKKLSEGYSFRINVTYWELVNITNRSDLVLSQMKMRDIENVTTKEGWVEVHLTKEGYPVYVEEYFRVVVKIKTWDSAVPINVTIHDVVVFRDINGKVEIKAPEGLEKALPLEGSIL